MVRILDINGKELNPTKRHGRVRRLLKYDLASVVQRDPFIIQLRYEVHDAPVLTAKSSRA